MVVVLVVVVVAGVVVVPVVAAMVITRIVEAVAAVICTRSAFKADTLASNQRIYSFPAPQGLLQRCSSQ